MSIRESIMHGLGTWNSFKIPDLKLMLLISDLATDIFNVTVARRVSTYKDKNLAYYRKS